MTYEYKQEGAYKLMHLPQGKRFGLIAEEVEEVLPSLVKATEFDSKWAQSQYGKEAHQTTAPSEKIEFKALNYIELIPIMIKGMQEQEAADKQKDIEIASLKTEVAELRQMLLELKNSSTGTVTATSTYLEQNTPNPVNGTTIIRYHVPETTMLASINITNAKGQVIKTVTLSKGSGQVSLNTAMLASGTYNYTLYVDGKQADTKRLVIAR